MTGDVDLGAASVGADEMIVHEATTPLDEAKIESKPAALPTVPPPVSMAAETSATQELHASTSSRLFQIPDIPTTDDVVVKVVDFEDDIQRAQMEADLRNESKFISKITEGTTAWKFNKRRSEQIKGLLESNEVIDEHGTGLHYYNLSEDHGIDMDMAGNPNLITRPHSRRVVTAIEDIWKNHQRTLSYIIGPPGVGKTRTLQLLLRRFLLDTSGDSAKSIRYYSQKEEFALWIILVDDRLSVFMATEKENPHGFFMTESLSGSMFEKSVVLLDPKEAEKGGAEFVHSRRHMVVACSADEEHFPIDPSKVLNLFHFYVGLWTRDELRRVAELKLISLEKGDTIDSGVIDQRANKVGEAPRYIFAKTLYNRRVKRIQERAKLLDADIVRSAFTDRAVERNGTVAGCFFAHINNFSVDGSSDYSIPNIRYLSRFSVATIYEAHRSTMLSAMAQATNDGGGLFELLAGWDVHTGGDFVVREMVYTREKSAEGAQESEAKQAILKSTRSTLSLEAQSKTKFLLPDTPTEITRTGCVQPLLQFGEAPFVAATFVGLSKCYPAIDYIGKRRDVYQATTGNDHDRNGWIELLVDAGILVSEKSPLAVAEDAKDLTFYWVVPAWKEDKWSNAAKTLRRKDCSGLSTRDIAVANKALRDHVVQRVLLIPLHRATVVTAASSL